MASLGENIPRPSAIPRPSTLQAALRKTTEVLAKELGSPTQCVPDWSDFEWAVARAVAAIHGVSPLLSRGLRWRGPAGWVKFLEQQRSHTTLRHGRIEALLRLIDHEARKAGIAAVALKGVALHALDIYRAGDRPMADVDLLVRPQDARGAVRVLERLGYSESSASWKERVFTPIDHQDANALGEHAGNDIKIELHERICERLPWRITDISEFIHPAEPRPGCNGYPSKASLMSHLVLHAAGGMAFQSLRLLHLHDLSRLSMVMTSDDWRQLLQSRRRPGELWWRFPPLELTSRYFPATIPAEVLAAAAADCPYWLQLASRRRSLCDVSLSHLWVDAFPGIEWSRSVGELIEYAASRLRPSAGHLAGRERLARNEAWARQDQWSGLSQGRRILRWVTSRPTRPATMHAIRAAL
jgi:putative nucleotidyltransferase-like protein